MDMNHEIEIVTDKKNGKNCLPRTIGLFLMKIQVSLDENFSYDILK